MIQSPIKSAVGFTIIELLVVIAVITALAGMLFPVFVTARSRAQKTACASNLHQLFLAVDMYSQDNDDYYPWAADMADLDTTLWVGKPQQSIVAAMPLLTVVLKPYVGSNGIWRCPADTGYTVVDCYSVGGVSLLLNATPSAFEKFGMSYAYNTQLPLTYQKSGEMTGFQELDPSVEQSETNIFLLVDSCSTWHGDSSRGRYNVLMGDGHVVYQDRQQFDHVLNTVLTSGIPLQ